MVGASDVVSLVALVPIQLSWAGRRGGVWAHGVGQGLGSQMGAVGHCLVGRLWWGEGRRALVSEGVQADRVGWGRWACGRAWRGGQSSRRAGAGVGWVGGGGGGRGLQLLLLLDQQLVGGSQCNHPDALH